MQTKNDFSKKSTKIAAGILACMLILALVPAFAMNQARAAVTASADFTSYEISIVDNVDYGPQALRIAYEYDDEVYIEGTIDSYKITINGGPSNRATDFAAEGNWFVIYLEAGTYTSVYNARLTVDVSLEDHVYIGGGSASGGVQATDISSDPSTGNFPETVIPLCATFETGYTPGDESTSVDVESLPAGNGMIHVGLYTLVGGSTGHLEPIYTGTSSDPIQVNTYPVFVDNYTNLSDEADLAALIVKYVGSAANLPNNYTLEASGATLTLTNATAPGLPMYIYIFDDNLLQNIGYTYQEIIDAGGVLEEIPFN